MKRSAHLFAAMLLAAVFLEIGPAVSKAIQIESRFDGSGPQTECLVVLSTVRQVPAVLFSNIKFHIIYRGSSVADFGPFDMVSEQAMILRKNLSEEQCVGKSAYYTVIYESQGVVTNYIFSPAGPLQAAPQAIFGPIIGGGIALISAVVVGILSHWLTVKRERAKFQHERYEKIEPIINRFLVNWNRSLSPALLEKHFLELRENAVLGGEVVDQYMKALDVLRNETLPVAEKVSQARTLEGVVQTFLFKQR